MKIVVLNGSPRKGCNTETMANAFVEAAGKKHEAVRLDIAGMNIKGCMACMYCWAHNGQCVQKDDMAKVFAELKDADLVVFASPIYWFDITAQLKTVIDRLYALGSVGFNFHKTALLLDSGADDVFTAAVAQYKAMTAYLKWEDMGIVKIPNMENKDSMKTAPQLAKVVKLAESL